MTVKRSMMLALGDFGRATLEEQATRHGVSPEELVCRAARHYVGERDLQRAARRLPRFRREPLDLDTVELELDLKPEVWQALDEESREEGVAVERLIEHALIYLVADLDAGRVAAGVLEDDDS